MRCFYVLVHATLQWYSSEVAADVTGAEKPAGFWCHRYVLAGDETEAKNKAFRRVIANLDRKSNWLSSGAAEVRLEAAEVSLAPIVKLFKPDNEGHVFYEVDDGS